PAAPRRAHRRRQSAAPSAPLRRATIGRPGLRRPDRQGSFRPAARARADPSQRRRGGVDTSIDERVAPMTTSTGVVIHTEELTKVYPGDIRAVIDLNLDVKEGEIFGLLGPNGAGKT